MLDVVGHLIEIPAVGRSQFIAVFNYATFNEFERVMLIGITGFLQWTILRFFGISFCLRASTTNHPACTLLGMHVHFFAVDEREKDIRIVAAA